MKRITMLAIVIFLAVINISAQEKERSQNQDRIQEHILMENGNLYRVMNQERIQLRDQFQLNNGGIINADGTYQLQNKNTRRLKDGQCLDMEGNRYRNQDHFNRHVQARTQAMNKEYLMMQNGQVYQYQNNERTQLQERFQLKNGTQINPDGNVQLRNKKQIRLSEGECVDMDGRRSAARDQLWDRMERRIQRMDRTDRNRIERNRNRGIDRTTANNRGRKNN